MKPSLFLSAAAALALVGCHKSNPPAPLPAAKPVHAAAPVQAAPKPPANPSPTQPAKTQLTADDVTHFVAYLKTRRDDLKVAVPRYLAQVKAATGKGSADAALKAANRFHQEMSAEEQKACQAAGLTVTKAKALSDAALLAYHERANAPSLAASLVVPQKARIAKLPAAQRAAAQAQLAQMQKMVDAQKDAADVRKKYGDAVVDALFQQQKALQPLAAEVQKLGMQALGGK